MLYETAVREINAKRALIDYQSIEARNRLKNNKLHYIEDLGYKS